jgi:hypothetical protein
MKTIPTAPTFSESFATFRQAVAAYEAAYTDEELEAAGDAWATAKWAVLETPAPDGPALLEKLRIICDEEEGVPSRETVTLILDDAQRLLAGHRDAWESRRHRFEVLEALANADRNFGPTFTAIDAAKAQRGDAKTPEDKAAALAAESRAEDERCSAYLEPLWAAAAELLHTPAPNAAAMAYKVELVTRLGFEAGDPSAPSPFDLIAADAARLLGQSA